MKYILVVLCILLLFGCTNKSASVSVAEAAKESISAVYKTLPKECQNDKVKQLLTSAKAQIEAVTVACDSEKEVLQTKISELQLWLGVLVFAIVGVLFLSRRR